MSEDSSSSSGPDDRAPPEPSAVMESLRAIGYSPATAIADLVDNSIAAGASNVHIQCMWRLGTSYIAVIDDGSGMAESALIKAMTLGSKSPLEARDKNDLGRFGMGLKTASFSQCRKLTVGSKTGGALSVREWDLDYIQNAKDWLLKRQTDEDGNTILQSFLTEENGTCVIWRNMDRIVDASHSEEKGKEHFLGVIEDIEKHLSMVFHRFLARRGRLKIFINKYDVKPWDPFLSAHDFTQEFSEVLQSTGGPIPVDAFVLPHRSRLSEEEFANAGGIRGWNGQQGLYVYRNDRLLVAGGWAGLGLRSEDQFNLARIAVDISNQKDSEWQLDIKKSRARPPNEIRGRLKQIGEIMQERSRQTYRSKGKFLSRKISGEMAPVWKERWKGPKLGYEINRQHPLIKAVLANPSEKDVKTILRLIEETLPLEGIAYYLADSPNARLEPFEDTHDSDDFKDVVHLLDIVMATTKMPLSLLESKLLEIEPFNRYPEAVLTILHRGGGSSNAAESPE